MKDDTCRPRKGQMPPEQEEQTIGLEDAQPVVAKQQPVVVNQPPTNEDAGGDEPPLHFARDSGRD